MKIINFLFVKKIISIVFQKIILSFLEIFGTPSKFELMNEFINVKTRKKGRYEHQN